MRSISEVPELCYHGISTSLRACTIAYISTTSNNDDPRTYPNPENAWPLPIYTLLNLLNPRMFSWVLET